MRVAVFGAGGYIGIPLCHELLLRGHTVIAIDRYFFGIDRMRRFSAHKNLIVSVADTRSFAGHLLDDVEAVVDLAGLSNDATSEIDPKLTREINVFGGQRVLGLSRKHGVRRYVYSSSASVYGRGGRLALTEEDAVAPLTAYANSKAEIERDIARIGDILETVILRNATVFGQAPRMRFDLAINIMTARAWREKAIYVMGSGEQWRPFVHVQDLAGVFADAVEFPAAKVGGQTFNIGSCNHQIRHIAQMVGAGVDGRALIHEIPDDPDKRSYNVSFAKMASVFGIGCMPNTPQSAIAEMLGALKLGELRIDDPTAYTLSWYKSMLEWDRRLKDLRLDGELL